MALVPFRSTVAVEGRLTEDGRLLTPMAVRWDTEGRPLPLPLRAVFEDRQLPHEGAVRIGDIQTVARVNDRIVVTGQIDDEIPEGAEVLRRLREGVGVPQPSVDLGDVDAEWETTEVDDDGNPTDGFWRFDDATLMGVTLVDIPAIGTTDLELVASAHEADWIVASVTADEVDMEIEMEWHVEAEAHWFEDPGFDGPTPLHVDETGRVFGHAALWGVCHIGKPGACTTAPRNESGKYAYFRTGSRYMESDGEATTVPTGPITMATGHPGKATATNAVEHYDNTGAAVADVACGEDAYGIWVAGALRSGVTDSQVEALRGSALSGDWRSIGGSLELVALLAVNVPGFPVPRMGFHGGEQTYLVAAGMMSEPDWIDHLQAKEAAFEAEMEAEANPEPELIPVPEGAVFQVTSEDIGAVVTEVVAKLFEAGTCHACEQETLAELEALDRRVLPQLLERTDARVAPLLDDRAADLVEA